MALLSDAGGAVRIASSTADEIVVAAYEAYHRELFSFLVRSTRNETEAEDLVQEAFVRLTTEARAGRPPDQIRAWLYRVAANLAVSRSRRQSTALRWLGRYGPAEHLASMGGSPEGGFIERERDAEIEKALALLATDARTALLMASQGFSGREIAVALDRSEVATRAMLFRARLRLREIVEGSR